MRVCLNPQGRQLEIDGVTRVEDLLRRLEILPGTVLVIRGEHLLTDDARLDVLQTQGYPPFGVQMKITD